MSSEIDGLRAENNGLQRALKDREDAHARELIDRKEAIDRLNARITGQAKDQIRAEARNAGAREESLSELELLLGNAIGFDSDMNAFVKDADGTPRFVQGRPMTIPEFVKSYVDGHPHHRRAGTPGGGARGGASTTFGGPHRMTDADTARARIESGDRSPGAINELFQATRKTA
jgi:hypothetical protein